MSFPHPEAIRGGVQQMLAYASQALGILFALNAVPADEAAADMSGGLGRRQIETLLSDLSFEVRVTSRLAADESAEVVS